LNLLLGEVFSGDALFGMGLLVHSSSAWLTMSRVNVLRLERKRAYSTLRV
jgi:hypothetical protein